MIILLLTVALRAVCLFSHLMNNKNTLNKNAFKAFVTVNCR